MKIGVIGGAGVRSPLLTFGLAEIVGRAHLA